jgi:hypothetical protein
MMAYADSGTITGFKDATATWRVNISSAHVIKRPVAVQDITGSASSGVHEARAAKRYVWLIQDGEGWLQKSGDSGSTWTDVYPADGLGSISNGNSSIIGDVSMAIIERQAELQPTTGATTTAVPYTTFALATPIYQGSVQASVQDSDSLFNVDTAGTQNTLTLPVGDGLTISGATVIEQTGNRQRFGMDGRQRGYYLFRYTSTVTAANTPFASTSWTGKITLNQTTENYYEGTVLLDSLRLDLDYASAGVVPVRFSGAYTGTITIDTA